MSAWEEHIEYRGDPRRAAVIGGPPIWAVVFLAGQATWHGLDDGVPREQRVDYVARCWGLSKKPADAVVAYCEEHDAELQADIHDIYDRVRRWVATGVTPAPSNPPKAVGSRIVRRGHPRQAVIDDGPPVWAVGFVGGVICPGYGQAAWLAALWPLTQEQAVAALAYYDKHFEQIERDLRRAQMGVGERTRVGRVVDAVSRVADWLHDRWLAETSLRFMLAIWLAAWVLFGLAHGPLPVGAVFFGAGLAVSGSFLLLFLLFLRPDEELPDWSVFAAFVLAFAGLVGAYAAANLAASHGGMAFHHGHTYDCYRDSDEPLWLHGLDAVYVALGTLTTSGAGEIVAHRDVCRALSVGELSIGFALLGLTVAGVGTRLFPARS